ncbi:MBL fold metallo-hydrolase [Chitinophagaceae bacterium MMS25-I14]
MKITFLGTGTSQGVPVIGCNCAVCTSANPKDNRLRSAIWIDTPQASIVIDTGPDFRYQMLRAHVHRLDAVLFTHGHKDHTAGLDDIRAYNYFQQKAMDVYATGETQETLRREFSYIFDGFNYPGIPQLNMHRFGNAPFSINGLEVIPVRVLHYKLEVFGFRIGDFTYITDANYIAPEELEKVKGSKYFVLNALRHEQHISHFSLEEAVAVANEVGAEQTYFTHISHQLGLHDVLNEQLPPHIQLAYDGLELKL